MHYYYENGMLKLDPDNIAEYRDILRYCHKCKQGKKLTHTNYSYKMDDMFKCALICKDCEKEETQK